jgi:hypothetical protein
MILDKPPILPRNLLPKLHTALTPRNQMLKRDFRPPPIVGVALRDPLIVGKIVLSYKIWWKFFSESITFVISLSKEIGRTTSTHIITGLSNFCI